MPRGRPKSTGPMTTMISIRIPKDVKAELDKAAEESDRTVTDYVIHAVKTAMGRKPVEVVLLVRTQSILDTIVFGESPSLPAEKEES